MKTEAPIAYNGNDGYLDYSNPQPDQIALHDIALSLSREARYNGIVGVEHGYSVAQHSVLVSLLVPQEYALAGLLHDGSEAYLRDLATPAKRLLPDYQQLEARVQGAVYRSFNLPAQPDDATRQAIKLADQIALATEVAYLMPKHMARTYTCQQRPIDRMLFAQSTFEPAAPPSAMHMFLARFESITKGQAFHHEPFLWTAQAYSIALDKAAMAVACLRSALSLLMAGKEAAAREVIAKMAELWPAPMPQVLRDTPLASTFIENAEFEAAAGLS